ncbi:di-trans,poly-cis-decaprenylcistransferase [archaeon]|nr:di-trans,poly-cis-decaprenylcistransferase [archaeon]
MLDSIAFIPDGNRRYALNNNLSLLKAYSLGFDTAQNIAEWCFERGMTEVTVWSVSTENLKRNPTELQIFLSLFKDRLELVLNEERIHKEHIRVNVIGKLDLLPEAIHAVAKNLMQTTKNYQDKTLNLCMGYGGRAEILDAVNRLVSDKKPITEESLTQALYLKSSPDLIIRTGNTQRLSGFLPWQSAYSELYFSKKLWPEFNRKDLDLAIEDYNNRERRFGL